MARDFSARLCIKTLGEISNSTNPDTKMHHKYRPDSNHSHAKAGNNSFTRSALVTYVYLYAFISI
jgi:hypothetical protein